VQHLGAAGGGALVFEQDGGVERLDQFVHGGGRQGNAKALAKRSDHGVDGSPSVEIRHHGSQRLGHQELLVGQPLRVAQQDVRMVFVDNRANIELAEFRIHDLSA